MSAAPPRSQQITSILMMVVLLVTVLVMRKQCAQGTATWFGAVAGRADGGVAGPAAPQPLPSR